MRKVNSCPFCWSREQDVETLGKVWHVYCINCGAIGPDAKDRQTAIARWNKRGNVNLEQEIHNANRRTKNSLAK